MSEERVCVVGAGVSGVGASATLVRNGFAVTIIEKSNRVGGLWADTYHGVSLQNSRHQYHYCDFPWPFQPDLHPTAEQIRRYIELAVDHYELGQHIMLGCTVTSATFDEKQRQWTVVHSTEDGSVVSQTFDYLVLAVGQFYNSERPTLNVPGLDVFRGKVTVEKDMRSPDALVGKTVTVTGFGKSALDIAVLAASVSGNTTHHVFRQSRWTLPFFLLKSVHFTFPLFARVSTLAVPAWDHALTVERVLHKFFRPVIDVFWWSLGLVLKTSHYLNARSASSSIGISNLNKLLSPTQSLRRDLRSAFAMAPENYYAYVKEGRIVTHEAQIEEFTPDGLVLSNGDSIVCDMVVKSLGSNAPTFPFLCSEHRQLLEKEGGPLLFRHIVHPDIPHLAFAGYNHCFLHSVALEVGTMWTVAYFRGHLELPPSQAMHASTQRVSTWKSKNVTFESTSNCGVNVRFQQYLDTLMSDLELSPYRKLPNVFAELLDRYGPLDYAGIQKEFDDKIRSLKKPLRTIDVDM